MKLRLLGMRLTVGAVGLVVMSMSTLAAFPPEINLSNLDGSNGFVIPSIDGIVVGGFFSGAGDINGDGIDDVIFSCGGGSCVVFGHMDGFPAAVNVAELDGSNGFVINEASIVSDAGDVNGDGIDDVITGNTGGAPNGVLSAGESYVVFGRTTGFPAALNPSELDGSNGFVINGINSRDRSGLGVSAAGDVNGDGIDDVIIGAQWADHPDGSNAAGESYVVFGHTTAFPATLNLSDLNGSNGFRIPGLSGSDFLGRSVNEAGDVNGDGIDDVIIGAVGADRNGIYDAGESYVVFGRTTAFPATLNLSDLNGSNGFRIPGISGGDFLGGSVNEAGDVNGDGIDDVIIGAVRAGIDDAGESYVVFGRTTGFPAALKLSELDGSNGFVIAGDNEITRLGISVSTAGDVNSDGTDDVIIGANEFLAELDVWHGEAYVVFGRASDFPVVMNTSDLDGSNGFVINGVVDNGGVGDSVSAAGDVNGDGTDDVIIGTPAPNGYPFAAGEGYVVFGRADVVTIDLDIKPGNKNNVINPRAKGGVWVAILSDTDTGSPFDPSSQVDMLTVEFGPDGAKANRHKVKDINKDGLGDLLLRFKIPKTGIACGDTEATLTGETFDGQSFTGTDDIKTVGCKPKKYHKKHHDDDRDEDKKHHGKHNEKKYHNKDHDNDHKKR